MPRPRRYFHGHTAHREPMAPYDVDSHIAALTEAGQTVYGYAKSRGLDFRTLSEGIREHRPDVADTLLTASKEGTAARKKGASLESSAKGMLERRGYYVVKSYASKSPLDMLAVGKDKPTLFVQAKAGGSLGSAEWNAVFELAETFGAWPVLVTRGEDGKGALWYRLARRREFREPQRGLLEPFDPRDPYALALAVA